MCINPILVICGVDEAGKGSVLGPMVIAGVRVASEDALSDLPVRDSKLLSPAERERLYPLIRKRCRTAIVVIDAHEIDAIRREMSLNSCVARSHAEVIRKLEPDIAYVDACDVNAERYAETVKRYLEMSCDVVSMHHADLTHPVVSAASIIAKVTRDRAMENLSKKYGRIGSGYPSDPVTISFLSAYIDKHGSPPSIARKSWKTVISLQAQKEQSTLVKFL